MKEQRDTDKDDIFFDGELFEIKLSCTRSEARAILNMISFGRDEYIDWATKNNALAIHQHKRNGISIIEVEHKVASAFKKSGVLYGISPKSNCL